MTLIYILSIVTTGLLLGGSICSRRRRKAFLLAFKIYPPRSESERRDAQERVRKVLTDRETRRSAAVQALYAADQAGQPPQINVLRARLEAESRLLEAAIRSARQYGFEVPDPRPVAELLHI